MEHRAIVKGRQTSSGTPRQRRRKTSEQRITVPSSRPTSEQRNTAPLSKTDEQAGEHRAIVEARQTSSGTPRQRRRTTSKQRITAPSSTRAERFRTLIRRASPIENLNSSYNIPPMFASRPPLFALWITPLNRHQRRLKEYNRQMILKHTASIHLSAISTNPLSTPPPTHHTSIQHLDHLQLQ